MGVEGGGGMEEVRINTMSEQDSSQPVDRDAKTITNLTLASPTVLSMCYNHLFLLPVNPATQSLVP